MHAHTSNNNNRLAFWYVKTLQTNIAVNAL